MFSLSAISKYLLCFQIFFLPIITLARPDFAKKKIQVGHKTITVEIADTPEKTAYGLMFKKTLNENEGMLFIFTKEERLSFWMKNTFIDLSIAYFDSKKILTEILEMKAAHSELQTHFENYQSTKPALYALEMNKGWFKKNNIKPGSQLKIF